MPLSTIKSEEPKKAWYKTPWSMTVAAILWCVSIIGSFNATNGISRSLCYVGCGIAAILWLATLLETNRRTCFYGIYRRERMTFWSRKRDDLVEKGIVAIVTAILSVCGTLFVLHIKK